MENIIEANFTEISETPTQEDVVNSQEVATNIESSSAPKMTVVIPAYNCRAEIERLLDSIVVQNWSKEDLEVVICDDNSTDGFMELVTPYADKLQILYYKTTPRDIHCPGNTRKDGLAHARGEWVTFIDNDDKFDEGAFDMVWNTIQTTGCQDMVFTIFHEWIDDKWVDKKANPNAVGGYGRDFDGNTWLHGNWYNRQWLKDNNIDFKENLESHEDLYFNSLCISALLAQNRNYTVPEANLNANNRKYAYTWIYRPNSLSRGYFSTEHFYIEVYLRDYIYSALEPWMHSYNKYCTNVPESAPDALKQRVAELKEFFIKQCVSTILYSFFYWEAGFYRIGDKVLPENVPYIKDAVDQVCFRFKLTKSEIIQRVYADPDAYMRIKQESFSGGGSFVELHTFRDFIMSL